MSVINTHNLGQFWFIASTITHRFGVLERLTIPGVHLRVVHQHSQFWPILARFMDYYSPFGVPKRFAWLSNSKVRLRVGHQQSQFGPILARFVVFWGPGVISTCNEPWCAFTCWSSTLVVLGRFWPVSCTITHRFGVPKHFPLLLNPKVCLRVGHQHS